MDVTAVDVTAVAAKDTTAVTTIVADSVGATETTNEAAEAATANSQPAARGTGMHVSSSHPGGERGQRSEGRHRAGKREIYQQTPAARSCWSRWLHDEHDEQEGSYCCGCRRPHACGRARRLSVCVSGTE